MTNDLIRARRIADEVFEAGSTPSDVRAALTDLAGYEEAFLQRLHVRQSLSAAAAAAPDPEILISEQRLHALKVIYESAIDEGTTAPLNMSDPKIWLAAKDALGGDVLFIMKLVNRQVTMPTTRFLRDTADALGSGLDSVRQHFARSPDLSLAGVDRKGSGKPRGQAVQAFDEAVSGAQVPDHLKQRWLAG